MEGEVQQVEVPGVGSITATGFFIDKLQVKLSFRPEDSVDEEHFLGQLIEQIGGINRAKSVKGTMVKFGDEPDEIVVTFYDADWLVRDGRQGYILSLLRSQVMPAVARVARNFCEPAVVMRRQREPRHERFAHRH